MSFDVSYLGKKLATPATLTPAYTSANPFLAKHAHAYFATNEPLLNAATETVLQNFKLNINKNLVEIQGFGSTDIDSIYNQQFTLDGDMEALFDSVTLRNYVVNSDKKAMRIKIVNTDATALITGIYPSIYIDLTKVGFIDRKKSEDLNGIVNQTMGFKAQYDSTTATAMEALLLNSTSATY